MEIKGREDYYEAVMYQDEGGFFVDRADRYIERI